MATAAQQQAIARFVRSALRLRLLMMELGPGDSTAPEVGASAVRAFTSAMRSSPDVPLDVLVE